MTQPILLHAARQLMKAEAPERRRALAALAAMTDDLEATVRYPAEWVCYRLGVDGAGLPAGAAATGDELLRDVSALAERLSDGLGPGLLGGEVLTAAALCERWRCGPKTVARARRQGLIGVRESGGDGGGDGGVVVYPSDRVKAFERRRAAAGGAGSRASGRRLPARLSGAEAERVVRRAQRYQRCLGYSLSRAAQRIAERSGRSHEGVRQVLLRAARTGARGALRESSPVVGERERRVLWRAARRGVEVGAMSRRYRRSRGAIRRAIALRRAELLRELAESGALTTPKAPTFARADADEVLLAPLAVRSDLSRPGAATLGAFLEEARGEPPPQGAAESARLIAYHYLRHWCNGAIAGLKPLHPAPLDVDAIESRLRWAARLKAELLRPLLRGLLDAMTARMPGLLEGAGAAVAAGAIGETIAAASAAIDAFDPLRGGRLAGAVGLAADRAALGLARRYGTALQPALRRAKPLHAGGHPMADWTRGLCAWQAWLEPDARWRGLVAGGRLGEEEGKFAALRYGWKGGPPMALREVARVMGLRPVATTLLDERVVRRLALLTAGGGRESSKTGRNGGHKS